VNDVELNIPQRELVEFCERHRVMQRSLFCSALRSDFGPESDIDILVEFEEGFTPGFGSFGMQSELSNMLGRRVDLNTPACLHPLFRGEVLAEARLLHVAA